MRNWRSGLILERMLRKPRQKIVSLSLQLPSGNDLTLCDMILEVEARLLQEHAR